MTYAPPSEAGNSAAGLLPEGNYRGKYTGHQCTASVAKGTPGIMIDFDIGEGKSVRVECWLSEATLGGMTGDQLRSLGWNGEYGPECRFEPPETVSLYMKHDTYKEKVRERWNISVQGKANESALAGLSRACQLWKARGAAQAPVPASAPKPPSRNGPAKAPPAMTKPPAKKRRASSEDEAWAWWVKPEAGFKDETEAGEQFWLAVEEVAPGKGGKELTADEWDAVAARSKVPF